MRSLVVMSLLVGPVATPAVAQDPSPTSSNDSVHVDSQPAPPTPEQQQFLDGLRTAGRGVAQLKDGLDRLGRAQRGRDTLQIRQAAKRLGGLCVAARGFIVSGRGAMEPKAYELPTRTAAKSLTVQLDSLSASSATCQRAAGKTPAPITAELVGRLRSYETALAAFRTAIGLPNR